MSAEQRDNNLGIDPELRNRDPSTYELTLDGKLQELKKGLIEDTLEPGWTLIVVEGPDLGKMVRLGEKTVTIGRGKEDAFQLRDTCVTRCQLVVEWDCSRQRHWLRQAGDSSTLINSIPATRNAGVLHELAQGDQIRIGGTVLRYEKFRGEKATPL